MPYMLQRYNPFAGTVALAHATSEMRAATELPFGMPFLVESATRHIPVAAFSYLKSISEVPMRKHKDLSAFPINSALHAGRALKSLHEHLQLEGLREDEADDDCIQDWVEDQVSFVSTITDRPLRRETITGRLTVAIKFLKHGTKVGLLDFAPDVDEAYRLAWGVDNLYNADGTRRALHDGNALRSQMIRTITAEDWRRLAPALGPTPREQADGADIRSCRSRVAASFGLRDALRGCEVTGGLEAAAIMAITVTDADANYEIMLARTKGGSSRKAHLRGRSVLDAQAYVRRERAICIASGAARGLSDWHEPTQLLVNALGSGRDVGRAAQAGSIQRDFRQAQYRIGMVVSLQRRRADGSVETVLRPKHSFHGLRHTAAFWELHQAIRRGDPDPIGLVQALLRHRRRSTCEVYLQPDRAMLLQVGDLMQTLLKDLSHD